MHSHALNELLKLKLKHLSFINRQLLVDYNQNRRVKVKLGRKDTSLIYM